jgi:hypothetical protein
VKERRLHFSFWLFEGVWLYRFIDGGLAPLGAVRRTHDPAVIKGIAERGGAVTNSEVRCMLDYALQQGQGGMYLSLSDDQYKRLK